MVVSWANMTKLSTTIDPDLLIPYQNLPGAGAAENGSEPDAVLSAQVQELFKIYSWKPGDGRPTMPTTVRPTNMPALLVETNPRFSRNATYEEFKSWNTEWQLYYLDHTRWAAEVRNETVNNTAINSTIQDAAGDVHLILRSYTDAAIYDLNQLQKRDYATLSKADQDTIAANSLWRSNVAATLGFIPSGTQSAADARATVLALVDSHINGLTSSINAKGGFTTQYYEDQKLFLRQYQNLKARIEATGLYNIEDITSKVEDIAKRESRAYEFMLGFLRNDPNARGDNGSSSYNANNPSSLDNGAGFLKAYKVFMAQEKRITEVDNQRLQISSAGKYENKDLDAPTMIYMFQQLTMLKVEAENNARSEEVNQFNELVKIYNQMQAAINEVVKQFDPKKSDEKRNLLGNTDDNATYFQLDATKQKLASMFDSGQFQHHPLEVLYGIKRPGNDNFNGSNSKLIEMWRDGWNSFGTSISDVITQINQESQILTNKLNSEDKAKNRHFELANNALSKMYDVLQNISRIG